MRREQFGESRGRPDLRLLAVLVCWLVLYSFLEAADSFSKTFAQVLQFARAEDEQRYTKDDQQVHRLENTFEHDKTSKDTNRPLIRRTPASL
jgi:hypothetical protein